MFDFKDLFSNINIKDVKFSIGDLIIIYSIIPFIFIFSLVDFVFEKFLKIYDKIIYKLNLFKLKFIKCKKHKWTFVGIFKHQSHNSSSFFYCDKCNYIYAINYRNKINTYHLNILVDEAQDIELRKKINQLTKIKNLADLNLT